MPNKCRTCNQLRDTSCGKDDCKIVKCSTIHYLSPNAKGELRGTTRRAGTVIEKENENDIERVKVEHVQLRIACSFKGRTEQSTFYKPLVTCPHCIAFITEEDKMLNETTVKENQSTIDNNNTLSAEEQQNNKLSAEEQQALNEAHTKLDPSVLTI